MSKSRGVCAAVNLTASECQRVRDAFNALRAYLVNKAKEESLLPSVLRGQLEEVNTTEAKILGTPS